MEDDVRQRINQLLSDFGTTQNRIANGDSAMQKRFSRQLNYGASITVDTLLGILDAFPEISPDWLLRGNGEKMTLPTTVQTNNCGVNSVSNSSSGNITITNADPSSKAEIERLMAENSRLKDELLQAKQALIDLLMKNKE